MGGSVGWSSKGRRKRMGLRWRPPCVSGRTSHVRERSGVATRAEPFPRFPGASGSLRGRGKNLRAGPCLLARKGRSDLMWPGVGGRRWLPQAPVTALVPSQAVAYGKCVQASTAPGGRLSKDLCAREFAALRSCFVTAVGGRCPFPALPAGRPGLPYFPAGPERKAYPGPAGSVCSPSSPLTPGSSGGM